MAVEEKEKSFKSDIDYLLEAFKKDPSLVIACKAICRKSMEAKRAKQFLARGVRCLSDAPDFLVKNVLADITPFDRAVYANMATLDCKHLFIWLLGGKAGFRLPSLKMPIEEFMAWCRRNASANTGRISMAQLQNVNWLLGGMGAYTIVSTGDAGDASVNFKRVRGNATCHESNLPEGFRIRRDQRSQWSIRNNYGADDATLEHERSGKRQLLKVLFMSDDEETR